MTTLPTRIALNGGASRIGSGGSADQAGSQDPCATATNDRLTGYPDVDLGSALVGFGDVPCQENDAEIWFADTPDGVEFAKSLCGTCPARRTCLDGALVRREPWGVWGGELFVQGVVVPRKRPRGRPRKDAALG